MSDCRVGWAPIPRAGWVPGGCWVRGGRSQGGGRAQMVADSVTTYMAAPAARDGLGGKARTHRDKPGASVGPDPGYLQETERAARSADRIGERRCLSCKHIGTIQSGRPD